MRLIIVTHSLSPAKLLRDEFHFAVMKLMPPGDGDSSRHAHILKLPMETLITIACFVKASGNTEITVFKNRCSTLIRLSLVHRKLRKACLAAGLYEHVKPTCKLYKASVELSHPLFQTDVGSLKSLRIDLGNMEAWPLYEVVMNEFPRLEELTFTGNANHNARALGKSGNFVGIQQFKGMSLCVSNACFNSMGYIITTLQRENIRQLEFVSSEFSYLFDVGEFVTKPLFPNLKKIKYCCVSHGCVNTNTVFHFANKILEGCAITHFEVQYGSGLYCCGERDHKSGWEYDDRKKLMESENLKYSHIKNTLLRALQRNSHNSLQILIVNDRFDNTFLNQIENYNLIPEPFSNLKLVVLRCKNLNQLIETEYPWERKQCSISRWGPSPSHHHSAWLYLADEYSLFYKCDCLLLETSPSLYRRPQKPPKSFWKKASARLLSQVWRREGTLPLLRYFIVGNESEGFQGIEHDLNIPFTIDLETEEIEPWAYIMMTEIDCRRVLDERLKYLQA
jgi:hypothetical protein